MSIGRQVHGEEQGHWIYYHYNGAKWTEGDYKNGEKIGVWKSWYDDGRINQEYNAENGPFKSWYQSGQVESVGQFVDGKRSGRWTFYHPNGKIFKEVNYTSDSINGSVTEYYDDGAKYFGPYTDVGAVRDTINSIKDKFFIHFI